MDRLTLKFTYTKIKTIQTAQYQQFFIVQINKILYRTLGGSAYEMQSGCKVIVQVLVEIVAKHDKRTISTQTLLHTHIHTPSQTVI